MFLQILLILVLLVIFLKIYLRRTYSYWKWRHVKFVKPKLFFGNMLKSVLKQESTTEFITNLYDSYPDERYVGIYKFSEPILLVRDPNLLKAITIKHFENFSDHEGFIDPETDPFWGKNLFSSQGERWRDLRQTLSPIFTSSKMRTMFILMDECAQQFIDHFKKRPENIIPVEMKDLMSRYANDVIATTAFGIKVDSIAVKDNEFVTMGQELTNMSGWNRFKFMLYGNFPLLCKIFKLKIVPQKIADFFLNIIKESISVREQKNIVRPDLIQLLMEARKGKLRYETDKEIPEAGFATVEESELGKSKESSKFLSDLEITAQAIIFFFGGFDTTSSSISFIIYELAVNPDIQSRLRQEIMNVEGKITYEKLFNLKYLDMVVSEGLRKWNQALFMNRKCTKKFTIEPERDGESPLTLEKGDILWIPTWALHHDPKYFPDPYKFDPERFSDENKSMIKPFTYLPFGSGPRNCIGSRFALMEAKILLYHLLREFEVVPVRKTPIPLIVSRDNFLLAPKGGFHLGFKALIN